MAYSFLLTYSLSRYTLKNFCSRKKRFPLVLMLEPTFKCNLTCKGCGRIRENRDVGGRMLSVKECLDSSDEAGAPVVCLTGGEPLLHPQIDQIINGLIERKKFIFLATNGIKLIQFLPRIKPDHHLSITVHLDGMTETHDRIVELKGTFDNAIEAIKVAKAAGFHVRTNTTIYKGTDPKEILELFEFLKKLKVDGMMVTPGFSYEAVDSKIFLSREETNRFFEPIYASRKRFPLYNTPFYLEFLAGKRKLDCVPWSTPARNPKGWKSPCYLLTDSYCKTFKEVMEKTEWEHYGPKKDERCAHCMVHVGYEADALNQIKKLKDLITMAGWVFLG
jgi:hopanoid biosynthesis associated radical SAM protein HpnH